MISTTTGHAIITGAAQGIGAATARHIAEAGNAISILDLKASAAALAADALSAEGHQAIALECDIRNSDHVEAAVASAVDRFGPPTVLVNNAGWDRNMPFRESTIDDWNQQIAINLYGFLHMHAAVLPAMLEERYGRIVNISSEVARLGNAGTAVYAACKSALFGFSKSLAKEHASDGITVNVVCPGPTETALLAEGVKDLEDPAAVLAGWAAYVPVGRLGRPDDVARMVAFLAARESDYITGQIVSVSGGLSMAG